MSSFGCYPAGNYHFAPYNQPDTKFVNQCPKCGCDDIFEANTSVRIKGEWVKRLRFICRNCFCKFV